MLFWQGFVCDVFIACLAKTRTRDKEKNTKEEHRNGQARDTKAGEERENARKQERESIQGLLQFSLSASSWQAPEA